MKSLITTPRLYLREIVSEDATAMYELNLDPSIKKFTGDDPFQSIAHAREFWEKYDHYHKHGYGRWAVVLKQTDQVIGWSGLKNNGDFIDLGYRLIPRYRGKGYATEAAKACLEYGFTKLQMKEIVGRASLENQASIKVLEKIGMRFWKNEKCQGQNAVYYKLSR